MATSVKKFKIKRKIKKNKNNTDYMYCERVNGEILTILAKLTFTQFSDLLADSNKIPTDKNIEEDDKLHIQFIKLKEYHNEVYSNNFSITKKYNFGKYKKDGRLFVENWGIQKFCGDIRGALCEGIYNDYDMINCQPSILYYLCEKHNIKCKFLKKYYNERDEKLQDIIDEYDVERGDAKILFIKSMFSKFPINKLGKTKIKNQFFKDFDKEMKDIQISFKSIYENEIPNVKLKGDNLEGQLLSHILCIQENKILQIVCKKFKASVLMFDGFLTEEQIPIAKLNTLSAEYGVKWSMKPHSCRLLDRLEDIDVSQNKLSFVGKDLLEIRNFLMNEKFKDKLLNCNNSLYFKDTKKWIMNDKQIQTTLFDTISNCDLYTYSNGLYGIIYKAIAPDIIQLKHLIEYLMKKAPTDNNFKINIWKDTKSKLYFNNGYYCFMKNKFISGIEDNRNTFIYIDREFNIERNPEIKNEIFRRVFNPIFSIKENNSNGRQSLLDHYLYKMARVFGGHIEDKVWFSMEGNRDCGKGMTTDFLKNTFNSYCGTTNADNFMVKANMGDSAKNLSYLQDFEFKRLVSINEIPLSLKGETILCGNKIKKVSSGGDTIEVRKNFQDETEIKLQSTFMFNYNDEPTIKPSDARQTQVKYYMNSKFIGKNQKKEFSNIEYYEKDNSVKTDFICNEDVMNEMAHIIFEYYKKPCDYPEQFLEDVEDDEQNDDKKLLSYFQFTNYPKDIIYNSVIDNIMKKSGVGFTRKKIKQKLKGKGAHEYNGGAKGRGLSHIKLAEEPESDDIDFLE